MTRRYRLVLASLIFAAAPGLLLGSSNRQESRPNILFIMSDDHTTQAIGAYGSRLADLNPTPSPVSCRRRHRKSRLTSWRCAFNRSCRSSSRSINSAPSSPEMTIRASTDGSMSLVNRFACCSSKACSQS